MFESIKEQFSNCADCGKSLFLHVNIYRHPIKKGKLLCESCNAKYYEYRNKLYLETLDKAVTNTIDRFYDCALSSLGVSSDDSSDDYDDNNYDESDEEYNDNSYDDSDEDYDEDSYDDSNDDYDEDSYDDSDSDYEDSEEEDDNGYFSNHLDFESDINACADKNEIASETDRPIIDGIINDEEYDSSFPKVLWILPEPFDFDKEGEVRIADLIDKKLLYNKIYKNIAQMSWCIQNGIKEVPSKLSAEQLLSGLETVAIIYVSKMPGSNTYGQREKRKTYKIWKKILKEQINDCDADIMLFCNLGKEIFEEYFPNANPDYAGKKLVFNFEDNLLVNLNSPSSWERSDMNVLLKKISKKIDF